MKKTEQTASLIKTIERLGKTTPYSVITRQNETGFDIRFSTTGMYYPEIKVREDWDDGTIIVTAHFHYIEAHTDKNMTDALEGMAKGAKFVRAIRAAFEKHGYTVAKY